MSPHDAMEYGLIDQVIERTSVGSRPVAVN
jgi:ATP-dependent Clp protease protease subunit